MFPEKSIVWETCQTIIINTERSSIHLWTVMNSSLSVNMYGCVNATCVILLDHCSGGRNDAPPWTWANTPNALVAFSRYSSCKHTNNRLTFKKLQHIKLTYCKYFVNNLSNVLKFLTQFRKEVLSVVAIKLQYRVLEKSTYINKMQVNNTRFKNNYTTTTKYLIAGDFQKICRR